MLLAGGLLSPACQAQPPAASGTLKIMVTEAGLYEITAADLRSAGWQTVRADALRLSLRGVSQPLWVEGSGSSLRLGFYGQKIDSRYTAENTYLLTQDSGGASLRMAITESDPQPGGVLSQPVMVSLRQEENQFYAPLVESGDHWLGARLPAPSTQTISMDLANLAPGPARIQVELWASTGSIFSGELSQPDHHVKVSVNGVLAADEQWAGKGRYSIQAEIPAGVLQAGKNQILLEAPGDTGLAADIVQLDWVEITFPQQGIGQDNRLEFGSDGGWHTLSGFSGEATVLDIGDPSQAKRILPARLAGGEAGFQGQTGGRYLAVSPPGMLHPARIVPTQAAPDLKAAGSGADYLVIAPAPLLEAFDPLVAWRRENGLLAAAVPWQAVVDQFGDGIAEPQALRSFLEYAAQNWHPAPRYVLLAGDFTYDTFGYQAPVPENLLPSFMIFTEYGGETASDSEFAQLDNDRLPDVAIGRAPASRPEQARLFVEKTLAYERQAGGQDWQGRILAVADGQEPSFRQDALAFVDVFGPAYQVEVYHPPAGSQEAGSRITEYFNQGALFIAYFGHGSLSQWGKDRLFTSQEAAGLSNRQRLPVVINMTCLTGLFTHPKVESLAEIMLWQAEGGAAAVLAPTSLTLASDQSFLSQPFARALLSEKGAILGDVFLAAQRQVPEGSSGMQDVLRTFLLFGDPALRLPSR